MIRDFLEPALRASFPNVPFAFQEQNAPFATLEAPCAEVGRLELCDDGDEVTVYFTGITHGHFGCYDDLTVEQKERSIAEDVADFLAALFADRVVLFRFVGGLAGGWSRLNDGQALPGPSRLKRQYVWSRAILDEKKG